MEQYEPKKHKNHVISVCCAVQKYTAMWVFGRFGAPGRTRTCIDELRRIGAYPISQRGQTHASLNMAEDGHTNPDRTIPPFITRLREGPMLGAN